MTLDYVTQMHKAIDAKKAKMEESGITGIVIGIPALLAPDEPLVSGPIKSLERLKRLWEYKGGEGTIFYKIGTGTGELMRSEIYQETRLAVCQPGEEDKTMHELEQQIREEGLTPGIIMSTVPD